jgi:hypothetical protein
LVILFPLIRISQNFVRFRDFREPLLRIWIVRVGVRMMLPGQLFVGLADLIRRGRSGNSKDIVIVAL